MSKEQPIDLLATNQTQAIELENAIRETIPNYEKFLQLFNKIGNNNPIIYETRKGTPITAVYLAASMGHLRMVEFIRNKLINKNPPLKITGRTPLHVAAQRGYLDIIECIFECLWKEDRNPKGQIKPKVDWRAIDSPKKQTNEFAFFAFLLFTAKKPNSFIHFLGESTRKSAYGLI